MHADIGLLDVKGLLPRVVRQILDAIGVVATLHLVRRFGGGTFRVPQRKIAAGEAQFQLLADAIGEDPAKRLVAMFGGQELYIALCDAALRELRNRQIRADFDRRTQADRQSALRAVAALAPSYRLSDRRIWEILNETDQHGPPPDSQATLF